MSRIRQVLVNNGYPQFIIDKIIRSKQSKSNFQNATDEVEHVKLYVQFYNLSKFKSDRKRLQTVVSNHVAASAPNGRVSIVAFYKPNKLSSQFTTRTRAENTDRVNVVYRFNCPEVSCNATYIGYTTQALKNRVKQHKSKSSSICHHYMYEHNALPPSNIDVFSSCFDIIFGSESVRNLKIVEAILIKSIKPHIKVKFNQLYDFLQLY